MTIGGRGHRLLSSYKSGDYKDRVGTYKEKKQNNIYHGLLGYSELKKTHNGFLLASASGSMENFLSWERDL